MSLTRRAQEWNVNQDLASSSRPNPSAPSRRPSRGLLDVTNVNINNSEIDKVTTTVKDESEKWELFQDSALFILSAARQALDATGDTGAPGAHGKVKNKKRGLSGDDRMLCHFFILVLSFLRPSVCAENPDHFYSLINHPRIISDHTYNVLMKRGRCLLKYSDVKYKDKDPTYAIFSESTWFKDIKYHILSSHPDQ